MLTHKKIEMLCKDFLAANPRTLHNEEDNLRHWYTDGFPAEGAHDFMREGNPEHSPVILQDTFPSFAEVKGAGRDRWNYEWYNLYFCVRQNDMGTDAMTAEAVAEAVEFRDEFQAAVGEIIECLADGDPHRHDFLDRAEMTINGQQSFPFFDGWVAVPLQLGVLVAKSNCVPFCI